MTFNEYFREFTRQGILLQIEKDHINRMLPTTYVERLEGLMKASQTPMLPETGIVVSTDIHQVVLYSLYKMDRKSFCLKKGQRNITLHSDEILDIVCNDDIQMRSFPSLDMRREYVTLAVATALLYCAAMRKLVEMRTLLDLCADRRAKTLDHAFHIAQDMLNDCRHFSKNRYDRNVLSFMNGQMSRSGRPIKKRAF